MPGFDTAFNTLLYTKVQSEADEGCRGWNDPAPSTFRMEDVEKFDSAKFYKNLSTTFPTLMTSLAAVATKKPSMEDGVKVNLILKDKGVLSRKSINHN